MMIHYRNLNRALRILQHSAYGSSTAINPAATTSAASATSNSSDGTKDSDSQSNSEKPDAEKKVKQINRKLTTSVFNTLKNISDDERLEKKIESASTSQELLAASETIGIQRKYALKIVSKLAELTNQGKMKIADFQGDSRFIRLCQQLGDPEEVSAKALKKLSSGGGGLNDLGVVLGVAGDDEAAKLISTISLPQMVKVLTSLSLKRRRSLPLLRSLAFNLGKTDEPLNIKQAADVLYACCQLNFFDEVLFVKVCGDLGKCIAENRRSAVFGSICTSLGMLRYKDRELMDSLCSWAMNNFGLCRTQDIVSLLLTLGAVNHTPSNAEALFTKLESHLDASDLSTPFLWLDVVWSLLILNKATEKHISSVLDPAFIQRLTNCRPEGIGVAVKLKLLNLNAAAKLLIDKYKGPYLDAESDVFNVDVPRSKEKQMFASVVIDTMTNLLPSSFYMNSNIKTDMGLMIDGECVMDSNFNPLPLVDKKSGEVIDRTKGNVRKGKRIAVVVLDFHDLTKGETDLVGLASLCVRLISNSNYTVMTIPHYEFNPNDKLVTRVKYLEQKLKTIVAS
ncbi:FAST kinase domain-containing protein 4 [Nilaparvata lugens]|uniref:FAST kinase domain-containing protein 4 n=1 Tax=Nilaparvata lugens TaxID=108931 RepID=UPI00193DD80E|nr:FAST kinase domain-containing protein 4 [Nilaparvata lugens]